MHLMEEMILSQGKVLPGDVLKVGSFLNQQIDTKLLRACGEEAKRLFSDCGITKVMTIEASGIALAASVAMAMDVPMVFAKKHKTSNVDGEVFSTVVHSYTHNADYTVVISRDYLSSGENVLLVDDFLASGAALRGLAEICDQAGAKVAGAVAAIEKCFQAGGDDLRAKGIRVESLACIQSMEDGKIIFRT